MSQRDSFPRHGAGERTGRFEFVFPLLARENDDIHGYIEVGKFPAGHDGSLVSRDGRKRNDRKEVDIAVHPGSSPCMGPKKPNPLSMNPAFQARSHLVSGLEEIHGGKGLSQ